VPVSRTGVGSGFRLKKIMEPLPAKVGFDDRERERRERRRSA
jgi:hypothetical protein